MTTQEFLSGIQKEILKSFLHIPNTMARLFDANVLKKLKQSEESIGNEEDKNNLLDQTETIDSLFSSTSENDNDLIQKIKEKSKEKKIPIDLFCGKAGEHFFINRVNRDIFDLKYNNNFIYNRNYNYSKLSEDMPKNEEDLNDLKKYLEETKAILDFFKPMNMSLEGEIDFIIKNVKKDDIFNILNDESKKYYVFGDKKLFQENIYEIFGEVTINLFHPSNYIHKLKQLLRYITLIKLYENNPDYFTKRGITKISRAIMIVTDGNYIEFIDQLANSKIFSQDYECNYFKSSSINEIINCKKFAEELTEYERILNDEKLLNNKYRNKLSEILDDNELNKIKKNYYELKKENEDCSQKILLKSRTINILRILKSSKIPFIVCYFSKIGGELPYNLFKDQPIFIERVKTNGNYKYNIIVKDLKVDYVKRNEFEDLKNAYQKMLIMFEDQKKQMEMQMENQKKQMEMQMENQKMQMERQKEEIECLKKQLLQK